MSPLVVVVSDVARHSLKSNGTLSRLPGSRLGGVILEASRSAPVGSIDSELLLALPVLLFLNFILLSSPPNPATMVISPRIHIRPKTVHVLHFVPLAAVGPGLGIAWLVVWWVSTVWSSGPAPARLMTGSRPA